MSIYGHVLQNLSISIIIYGPNIPLPPESSGGSGLKFCSATYRLIKVDQKKLEEAGKEESFVKVQYKGVLTVIVMKVKGQLIMIKAAMCVVLCYIVRVCTCVTVYMCMVVYMC